jgi:nitrite reductase/ring-hydroxylating ferredoxin subunit
MSAQQRVGAAADLPPGTVVGAGRYALGNAGGRYFAVTRRCRHLGADLAGGSIDENGCLVCPWHRSAYDVGTGRMVRGPQGIFARVLRAPVIGLVIRRRIDDQRQRSFVTGGAC